MCYPNPVFNLKWKKRKKKEKKKSQKLNFYLFKQRPFYNILLGSEA